MAAQNKFKQARASGLDEKNDLGLGKARRFVYQAARSPEDHNAAGTVPAFRTYSFFLMRKTPFS
jgi:hypothetical protein